MCTRIVFMYVVLFEDGINNSVIVVSVYPDHYYFYIHC